jgi:hypothetical protein
LKGWGFRREELDDQPEYRIADEEVGQRQQSQSQVHKKEIGEDRSDDKPHDDAVPGPTQFQPRRADSKAHHCPIQ